MAVITLGGVDYPAPATPVQADSQATSLEPNMVPTGGTIANWVNSKRPKNYGTPVNAISSGYVCPSDGVIVVAYGINDTGYCYVIIGNSPQLFTHKNSTNVGGSSFMFNAFAGQKVTYTKTNGSVNFIPYTY